jgi:sucrose-6F-phosphate phosphohydrolase
MDPRRLLVTDLDGTLLGDDAALDRFRSWFGPRRTEVGLVYASGRHLASIRGLVDAGVLPPPDAVISAVGTEVHDRDGNPFPGWAERLAGWDAGRVREVLRPFRWLVPQASEFQSPVKTSYEVDGLTASDDATIRRTLSDAGLSATVVCSGGRYVDVLPALAGKGRATRFLADAWAIDPGDVLVFGDSGNDTELLTSGFRGTMVANAHPDLMFAVASDVYLSPKAFADGVIDGVTYWSAIPT